MRVAQFVLAVLLLLTLSPPISRRPIVAANAPSPPVERAVAGVARDADLFALNVPDLPLAAIGERVASEQPASDTPVAPTLFRRPGWHAIPRQRVQVPIFMYHYVRINPDPADRLGFNLSVPPADLAAQLAYLAGQGYRTAGLEEVAGFLSGGREEPPPPRSVVLTFDDGYRDSYDAAYPLLRKYGFRATIFVISGLVGRPGYLTWPQLRQMAASGITIGAHTIGHPDLTRLARADALREIRESKMALERELERPVSFFAYPSGRFNREVVAIVQAAGYEAAVTVDYGVWHAPEDRFTLARVRVSGGQSLASLMASAGLGRQPPSAAPAPALRTAGGPAAE